MMDSVFFHLRRQRAVARTSRWVCSSVLLWIACAGCSTEEVPKASLFEDDHAVAAHWPDDLGDLSDKLRKRTARYNRSSEESLRREIQDLVGWVGEVAADTNLSEADWIPLYQKSETVSANLRDDDGQLSEDTQNQIESLCRLIDDTISRTSDPLASVKSTAL